jgi:uncharacterized membrane protein
MHTLSVGDCISYAWEAFKKRPWILIGGFVLAMIISAIPNLFGTHPEIGPDGQPIPHPMTAIDGIVAIASIIVSVFISMGLTHFALKAHDNIETTELGDLWFPQPFWPYLLAYILTVIIIALGFVALIVPGIILAMGLAFVSFLVVDKGLGPMQAIEGSWRITKGHKWQLFLLFLALLGINLLGVLALVVGVVVTAPITLVAFAHAYRTLSS